MTKEQQEAVAAAAPAVGAREKPVHRKREHWGVSTSGRVRAAEEKKCFNPLNRQGQETAMLPGHCFIPLGSQGDALGQGGPLLSHNSQIVPLPPPLAPVHPNTEGGQGGYGMTAAQPSPQEGAFTCRAPAREAEAKEQQPPQ